MSGRRLNEITFDFLSGEGEVYAIGSHDLLAEDVQFANWFLPF